MTIVHGSLSAVATALDSVGADVGELVGEVVGVGVGGAIHCSPS